jgi:hypothetical protein
VCCCRVCRQRGVGGALRFFQEDRERVRTSATLRASHEIVDARQIDKAQRAIFAAAKRVTRRTDIRDERRPGRGAAATIAIYDAAA